MMQHSLWVSSLQQRGRDDEEYEAEGGGCDEMVGGRGAAQDELLALHDLVGALAVEVRLALLGGTLRGSDGGGGVGVEVWWWWRRRGTGGGAVRGRRRRPRGARGLGRGGAHARHLQRAPHLEHDLHVVRGAAAADAPVQIVAGGRGDEVVVVAWQELQATRLRGERPEGDREVHQFIGLVAHGDDAWVGIRNTARLVLVLRHVVDNVLLHVVVLCTRRVHRTDQIRLVVLEL